jgi:hypothetical protein
MQSMTSHNDKRHPVSASDFRLLTESQKYGLYAECFRSAERTITELAMEAGPTIGEGIDSPHNACMFRNTCRAMKKSLQSHGGSIPADVVNVLRKARMHIANNGAFRSRQDMLDEIHEVMERRGLNATDSRNERSDDIGER